MEVLTSPNWDLMSVLVSLITRIGGRELSGLANQWTNSSLSPAPVSQCQPGTFNNRQYSSITQIKNIFFLVVDLWLILGKPKSFKWSSMPLLQHNQTHCDKFYLFHIISTTSFNILFKPQYHLFHHWVVLGVRCQEEFLVRFPNDQLLLLPQAIILIQRG